MFRIGEFSTMSKTTVKTLRYYDEVSLLKPEYTDPFTNHRFYTTNQLIRLHQIQALRQTGLSIDEIKFVLSGKNVVDVLQKRRAELMCQLADTQDQLLRIEFILQGKEEEDFMNYTATIKNLPECIVYSKKMTLPNYDAYFDVIPAIGKQVAQKYPDLKCTVPGYCFTIYLDGEYKERDIHIEFCEAVNKMKEDFDDIHFKKMDSIPALSLMHKGAYSNLSKAYAYAFKWIEENGYVASASPRESYIDGIWNKESMDDWLTELQIPVIKK
jgi:DNA-binding transcriptional MerR regulator